MFNGTTKQQLTSLSCQAGVCPAGLECSGAGGTCAERCCPACDATKKRDVPQHALPEDGRLPGAVQARHQVRNSLDYLAETVELFAIDAGVWMAPAS